MLNRLLNLQVVALFLGLTMVVGCQSAPEPTGPTSPAEATTEVEPAEEPEVDEPQPAAAVDKLDEEEARELAARISDQDLEVFAEGVRAVAEREEEMEAAGRDMETRKANASSPIEMVEIEQQTLVEMQEALAEVGLEMESFLKMAAFIRQNPILMNRVGEVLEDEEMENFFGVQ